MKRSYFCLSFHPFSRLGGYFHLISWAVCLATQSCPTLCDPIDCSPPCSSVHGIFPGKNTGVGCHGLLQGNLPNPGIKPRSPAFQADSFPAESPGKPMNTAVGRLSLLQGNLPDPGIELGSSAIQVDSLPAELPGKPFPGLLVQK